MTIAIMTIMAKQKFKNTHFFHIPIEISFTKMGLEISPYIVILHGYGKIHHVQCAVAIFG